MTFIAVMMMLSIIVGCGTTKNMEEKSKVDTDLKTYEEVKDYYLRHQSDKQRLKSKLIQTVLSNPADQADLFALFLLNTDDPFYYLGGSTFAEIGKYVEPELFKKVCIHLLINLENSKDLWVDIQQIGRWVNQDFVPSGSTMEHEDKIEWMLNKMMDFFEDEYEVTKTDNKQ